MGTIVAIGGMKKGIENMRFICEEIMKKSKKENPQLLYVPTANNDHKEYSEYMINFFESNFKCVVDTLLLINQNVNLEEIKEKILKADIVFVEGGDLVKLLETWESYGLNNILKQAYEKGTIMSGISAGAICWFEQGFSDSVPGKEFDFVKCLGFVKGYVCPHYNDERRKSCFIHEIRNKINIPDAIYGIEDDNAIFIIDEKIEIVSSNKLDNSGVSIIKSKDEIS